MLAPRDAWRRLATDLAPLPATRLPRREALGLVLAEPVDATVDAPATDVSAMDGYGLFGDLPAGTSATVTASIAAGDAPLVEEPRGSGGGAQVVRIMTGAPVPPGVDRIVPIESTDGGVESVRIDEPTGPGAHIRRRGEVSAAGDPLLSAGVRLSPAALGLLAGHGVDQVPVHRPPRVRVLTTGDEVVPPERTPAPGQLRDSHTDFLERSGRGLGLRFESLGIAPDDRGKLTELVAQGLEGDVLIVCGGVSKGAHDHVRSTLEGLGCEVLFHGVAVQPGKPLLAARRSAPGETTRLVFGLPGNPASVLVTYRLFVQPTLRSLLGFVDGFLADAVSVRLEGPLPGASHRARFLPGSVTSDRGELSARPHRPRGSHDLAAFATANALLHVPPGSRPSSSGDTVEAIFIDASR